MIIHLFIFFFFLFFFRVQQNWNAKVIQSSVSLNISLIDNLNKEWMHFLPPTGNILYRYIKDQQLQTLKKHLSTLQSDSLWAIIRDVSHKTLNSEKTSFPRVTTLLDSY